MYKLITITLSLLFVCYAGANVSVYPGSFGYCLDHDDTIVSTKGRAKKNVQSAKKNDRYSKEVPKQERKARWIMGEGLSAFAFLHL